MDQRIITKLATKEKRKSQTCKVYELKLDYSHLSHETNKHLHNIFKEGKWFYNYCLNDIKSSNTNSKVVPVKIIDPNDKEINIYEDREFKHLGSHMRQSIKDRLFGSLKSLKALKEKGFKVGALKFKRKLNSIPLKEFGSTYDIDFRNHRARITGLKKWIPIIGLQQIPKDAEIACATLIRKSKDFYLNLTVYQEKKQKQKNIPKRAIGIDFGCSTQLTFDNFIKMEFQIPISKRLRRLDRKIAKRGKKKNSKNKFKDQLKRKKEYGKIVNKKKDIRNKTVSVITNNFQIVCFQDESIHAWHASGHGKSIQNSGIGGILNDLKYKSHTPIMVNKFFPSTKECPKCHKKNVLELEDRIYVCECGYIEHRDAKSAICIKTEALKTIPGFAGEVPTDGREFTLGEILSSARFFAELSKINNVKVSKIKSLSQEASRLPSASRDGSLICEN